MSERELLQKRTAECCRDRRCEEAISVLEQILRRYPRDVEAHSQIGACYSGGCRQHSLTQPDIARAHFLQALQLQRPDEDLELRAHIFGGLGYVYAHSTGLSEQVRLRSTIEYHEKAAQLYWALGQLDSWAREQHNLGNRWCDLPETASSDKWRKAIEHYENALVVRTRDKNPDRHAATLQNLGTAYRELPTGEKGANVRRAIDCYRKALRIYTPALPSRNAALHNNLGNAYLSLPDSGRSKAHRNAQRALRHFERAQRTWSSADEPCSYAVARYNSGTAMMQLSAIDADPERCEREAATCFLEAAERWVLCGQAELAATAQKRHQEIKSRVQSWDSGRR